MSNKMDALIQFGGGGGLSLEETWFASQMLEDKPLICLINSQQPPQPSTRIPKKVLLSPNQMINLLQHAFPIHLNSKDVIGQLRRWGELSPDYLTLVFDGEMGHAITLIGIDRRTGAFIYYDPWPERSLLCKENNIAGVAAAPYPSGERLWFITPEDFEHVIYAAIVPYKRWMQLTENL